MGIPVKHSRVAEKRHNPIAEVAASTGRPTIMNTFDHMGLSDSDHRNVQIWTGYICISSHQGTHGFE
jgi:hypothetical protein